MFKAFDVIVKALKTQRNFKNPDKEIQKILMNMEG